MGFPPAPWRSMSPSPASRKNFPTSREFYIDGADAGDSLTIYALLEGPSIVGACRFVMTRGKGVIMDIDQALYSAR